MTSLSWIELEALTITLRGLGIDPPSSVAKALHLVAVAKSHVAEPNGSLLNLSDAQIRRRVEELSIRRHGDNGRESDRGMRPGLERVLDQLSDELVSAVVPELDDLIVGLQPQFAEAAEPLHVAAREFNIESMTSSDDIIDRDDFEEAGAAWKAMRAGWFQLAPIVNLRIRISQVFKISPNHDDVKRAGYGLHGDDSNVNMSVLFCDAWSLDPDAYHVEGDRRNNLDWLQMARSGLKLRTVSDVQRELEN